VTVKGEVKDREALKLFLRQAADQKREGGPGSPSAVFVLIRADRGVKYSQFMDVVNQLQYDGYYKIGLISEDLG